MTTNMQNFRSYVTTFDLNDARNAMRQLWKEHQAYEYRRLWPQYGDRDILPCINPSAPFGLRMFQVLVGLRGATNEEMIERCWLQHVIGEMLENQGHAKDSVDTVLRLMQLEPWQQQILDAAKSGRPASIPPMRSTEKEKARP